MVCGYSHGYPHVCEYAALHELGPSVVSLCYKIPVRSIALFIFEGVAQIGAAPPSAVAEFWNALAGPRSELCAGGYFALLRPVAAGLEPLLSLVQYLASSIGSQLGSLVSRRISQHALERSLDVPLLLVAIFTLGEVILLAHIDGYAVT